MALTRRWPGGPGRSWSRAREEDEKEEERGEDFEAKIDCQPLKGSYLDPTEQLAEARTRWRNSGGTFLRP